MENPIKMDDLGVQLFLETPTFTSWWLNPPISKICSSNWIIFPGIGVKMKNMWVATTQFVGFSQYKLLCTALLFRSTFEYAAWTAFACAAAWDDIFFRICERELGILRQHHLWCFRIFLLSLKNGAFHKIRKRHAVVPFIPDLLGRGQLDKSFDLETEFHSCLSRFQLQTLQFSMLKNTGFPDKSLHYVNLLLPVTVCASSRLHWKKLRNPSSCWTQSCWGGESHEQALGKCCWKVGRLSQLFHGTGTAKCATDNIDSYLQ